MKYDITGRDLDCLVKLNRYIQVNGFSPTIRELGVDMGMASSSTPAVHVRRLIADGYVAVQKKGMPRTMRVTKKGHKVLDVVVYVETKGMAVDG